MVFTSCTHNIMKLSRECWSLSRSALVVGSMLTQKGWDMGHGYTIII